MNECPTEFNIATSLLDCDGYNKRMQESTDPLKYVFDFKPPPICFMPGQTFQGLQSTGERRPPPSLMEVERYLQNSPLVEADNDYIIDDIRSAKPPKMPKALSNRLVIPECKEILGLKRTKIKRTEFPEWSSRSDLNTKQQLDYMRPGRDTRMEMREAYKKWDAKNVSNSNIYGVGKYDKRALRPVVDVNCYDADADMGCMHVKGPDAVTAHGTKQLDPTLTFADTVKKIQTSSAANAYALPTASSAQPSADTQKVLSTLDQTVPYYTLLDAVERNNAKNLKFYAYSS